MTSIQSTLAVAAIACSLAFGGSAVAQMPMDHSKMSETAAPAVAATPGMTDGEVRKIDKETGKITLKHGEIKNLDMPPMTMVFTAKDKAMLDKVQVGEKVQFSVILDAGKMVITDIKPAK